MKCQDCIDKENNLFALAKYVLVDYDSIRLLCQNCLDDHCRMEGELNLDFYDLEMDLTQAFKKISEVLDFRSIQYRRVLKENSELTEKARKLEAEMKEGAQPTATGRLILRRLSSGLEVTTKPEIVKCSCGETFDWENWDRKTWPVPKGVQDAVRHLDMGHTLGTPKEASE